MRKRDIRTRSTGFSPPSKLGFVVAPGLFSALITSPLLILPSLLVPGILAGFKLFSVTIFCTDGGIVAAGSTVLPVFAVGASGETVGLRVSVDFCSGAEAAGEWGVDRAVRRYDAEMPSALLRDHPAGPSVAENRRLYRVAA